MSEGYEVAPATLRAIVGALGDSRSELELHTEPLAARPDAGRSSDEVSKAFGELAGALTALAASVGGASTALSDSVEAYEAAEDRATSGFAGLGEP